MRVGFLEGLANFAFQIYSEQRFILLSVEINFV